MRYALTLLVVSLSVLPAAGEKPDLSPVSADRWDAEKAAHLLRRAGFGGTPEEILKLSAMSPEQAVAVLLDAGAAENKPLVFPPFEQVAERYEPRRKRYEQRYLRDMQRQRARRLRLDLEDALEQPVPSAAQRAGRKHLGIPASQLPAMFRRSPAAAREPALTGRRQLSYLYRKFRSGQPLSDAEMKLLAERQAASAVRRQYEEEKLGRLFNWWVARMVSGEQALQEKMVLFWHGHFATSYATVRNGHHMKMQNDLFRKHALGSFRELVRGISRDPAMLRYLDGNRNLKRHPNENYARELMELFTIGIGNYTEKDIKEAARAFTGWGYRGNGFVFNKRQHDEGPKTFFGKTGKWGGEDVIRILLEQRQTARFIARKLCRFFVAENPDPQLVDALAETLRQSDYEVKPVLRRLFLSNAFYDRAVVGRHIKCPTELVVGTIRQLGLQLGKAEEPGNRAYRQVGGLLRRMGQHLFHPPNVKGWDGGRAWINSQTMLVRYNHVQELLWQMDVASRVAWQRRRRANRKAAGRRPPATKIALFDQLRGLKTPDQVIDHLAAVLLQRNLPVERRAKLKSILVQEGELFEVESARTRQRLRKVLLLITAMPEYQLS